MPSALRTTLVALALAVVAGGAAVFFLGTPTPSRSASRLQVAAVSERAAAGTVPLRPQVAAARPDLGARSRIADLVAKKAARENAVTTEVAGVRTAASTTASTLRLGARGLVADLDVDEATREAVLDATRKSTQALHAIAREVADGALTGPDGEASMERERQRLIEQVTGLVGAEHAALVRAKLGG